MIVRRRWKDPYVHSVARGHDMVIQNTIRLRKTRMIEDNVTFEGIITVSLSTIDHVLKRNRVRMKQVFRAPFATERVKELRYQYVLVRSYRVHSQWTHTGFTVQIIFCTVLECLSVHKTIYLLLHREYQNWMPWKDSMNIYL